MSLERSASRLPAVLIASGQDWVARSLESILLPHSMDVSTVLSGQQALDYVRSRPMDAVILDTALPDASTLELCRVMRESGTLEAQTPILIIAATEPARRKDRLDALKAGAWGYYDLSLDTEEVVLRLGTYLRAKMAANRIRESSLEDELTGLYSLQGLLRRLREMGSDAYRHHRALACLAIAAAAESAPPPVSFPLPRSEGLATRFAQVVRQSCRASDTVARLPGNEFVVVAPETDFTGAERLATRIATAAEGKLTDSSRADTADQVRIGLYAVSDFAHSALQPADLLEAATIALNVSKAGRGASRIVRYTPDLAAQTT